MPKLLGIGLPTPDGFPVGSYNTIYQISVAARSGHAFYEHFAGAWAALAYRYRSALDCGADFVRLFEAYGPTPHPEQRYLQEKALFDFFSSGFSAFECAFYGLYTLGAFLSPMEFPLGSEKHQQRVSPSSTNAAFGKAFQGDPLLHIFTTLFAETEYRRWREIRNVLTHRIAPGRMIYVSIGGDEELPTEWKLTSSPLDKSIVSEGRSHLSRMLNNLLAATASFAKRRLS